MLLYHFVATLNMDGPLSTLEEVSKHFWFLKFLGDTLYFEKEDGNLKVKFRCWPFLIALIFCTLTMGYSGYATSSLLIYSGKSMNEVMETAHELNMGWTDVISINGFIVLNVGYVICCGILNAKLAKHMNNFNDDCIEVASKHGLQLGLVESQNTKENLKCTMKRLPIIFGYLIVSMVFLAGAFHEFLKGMILLLGLTQEMNITYLTIATIMWLPFLALTTMPMPGLAVEALTWISIKYMTEAFHKFKNDFLGDGLQSVIKRLESVDYETRKEMATQRCKLYLAYGEDLDKLTGTLCKHMATTIFLQYSICLLNGTLAGYQFLGLFLRLKRLDLLAALMFGSFTFMFAFYFVRLFFTTKDSQELNEAMKSTGEEIEDLIIDCPFTNEMFEDQIEYKIKRIIKSIKEHTCMSPMGLFCINNAAFLTILSTIMTYIIVLMQIKTTELPLTA